MKTMFRYALALTLGALILSACGRKEAPQPEAVKTMPVIAQLNVDHTEEVVRLRLRLEGGRGAIGYQLDRAELDPYCKCPDMWRRYYELPPSPNNRDKELVKVIRTEAADRRYLYRLRAVDSEGHLGHWSKVIQVETKQ